MSEAVYTLPLPQRYAYSSERAACDMGRKSYHAGQSLEDGMQSLSNLIAPFPRSDEQALLDAFEACWLYEENQDAP